MDNLLDFAIHLPYLTIALIGLAILILSVLLDGLFDFLDFGDGILSVTTFSAFITIFGFVGVICTNLTLTAGITLLISTLSGLTVATLTMRMMKKMTTPDTLNSTTVIGRTGTVTLPLNPPNNLGEISVPYQGESQYYTAIADTPIPLGTEVTVTQVLSPTNVKIQIKEKP